MMESKAIIRNRATGMEDTIPAALWKTVKNAPQWRGVFELVRLVKEPPEVVELNKRLAARQSQQANK
jgi:hypothetical protein